MNGHEVNDRGERTRPRPSNHSPSISLAYCLFLIFAAVSINIASHNLHGFKSTSAYHRTCIQRHEGVWLGQETWLSEKQFSTLSSLGTQYVARSAMEDAISSGILRGRPFGGVCIAWSPKLDGVIKPLTNFRHKRVVGVELESGINQSLIINIYMPFFDASKREACMIDTIDAISMVETIIESHPLHSIIIGGDFNSELKGDSPFDTFWNDLCTKFDLIKCDKFISNSSSTPTYTYSHDSLGQRKWNDHFLISRCLESQTTEHSILNEGDNPSDHLPIMFSLSFSSPNSSTPNVSNDAKPAKLRWDKITPNQLQQYANRLSSLAEASNQPLSSLRCESCHCSDSSCHLAIQQEYDLLLSCLEEAAAPLPRHKPGVEKDWWTRDLTILRDQSISIHRRWVALGKPRQGAIHLERLRIRAAYKKALRDAQKAPKQKSWNRLHSSMVSNDTNSFWKSWKTLYSKNNSSFPPVVDGQSSKSAIATSFQQHFEKNARPNNRQKVEELNDKFSSKYAEYCSSHEDLCNCQRYHVSFENVIDAVMCLKAGKSSDDDGISAEHFLNAPYAIFTRLQQLLNAMLTHSFVPRQFTRGSILPLVKDNNGNRSDINNYRGITISPIASKVLEHLLKSMLSPFLATNPLQFGFKKKSSTMHAAYCLKETINHYVDNGSRVFCAFLDASKAFDRLVHAGLFIKLIARGVPLILLNIIIYWYSHLSCRVKWDNSFSVWFSITAGVRQGGILSPDFYCLYVEDLIEILKAKKVGCHILTVFLAALIYADDMAILAPSIKGLCILLEACNDYCIEWDICLNAHKSKLIYFGSRCTDIFVPSLNDTPIEWVESVVYLGVCLISSKYFKCSVTDRIRKFYKCANAIFRIEGRSDDLTMLSLVESHCVPILTYGIEIADFFDRRQRSKIRAAYNSLFRKIFGYRNFESVTELQLNLARPTWELLCHTREASFHSRLAQCPAESPVHLFSIL